MIRPRWGLAVLFALTAAPAQAHGDMAAKGLGELFGLALGALFLVVSIVLGAVAWRLTSKVASAGAVFRAAVVGMLALTAFALACAGLAMGADTLFGRTPPALGGLLALVPALFAAQAFVSARLYRRFAARGLAWVSTGLGILLSLGAAFVLLAVYVDATVPPSERTTGEVRRYREGCERDDRSDCNMLGLRLRAGDGIARDPVAAARAFEKACNLEASIGCRNLADQLSAGDGVPRDEAAAHRWLERYAELERDAGH